MLSDWLLERRARQAALQCLVECTAPEADRGRSNGRAKQFERAERNLLHVAISPWADIEGAKAVGLRVAWINRDQEQLGSWTAGWW